VPPLAAPKKYHIDKVFLIISAKAGNSKAALRGGPQGGKKPTPD
jgi:hypothetical protein